MTLTDEELAEIEGRARTVFKATWSDVLVIAEKDVPRLISTLREERAEVKRLREALEGCFYNRPGWQDKARAAIFQPPKEGEG